MKLSELELYRGRIIDLFRERHRLPNGHEGDFEIIRHPGGCAVLPLFADGTVQLIRQYRAAVGRSVIEIPAGRLEADETAEQCIVRELAEEVGLRAGRLERLGGHWSAIGYCNEWIELFLATDLNEIGAAPESDEWIEPFRMPLDEALQAVAEGEICDAKSQLALFLASRRLEES